MASELSIEVLVNYAILGGYFAIIFACFGAVIASILSRKPTKVQVLSGRPFLFIRAAVGGLISTWYCKYEGSGSSGGPRPCLVLYSFFVD